MRILILSLLIIAEIIIESTIFPFIQIRGATPDLVLITIISFGLINGKKVGITIGLIGGLLLDILFGMVLGLHALPYMLIGYFMGIFCERVFRENRFIPFVFTILGTLILHGIFYLLQYLRGIDVQFTEHIKNFTYISIILNAIVVVFVYPLFIKLSEWHLLKER